MSAIRFDFDFREVDAFYSRLSGTLRGLPQVLAASVNDATKSELPNISRAIRGRVNIKQADLDPKISRTIAEPSLQPTANIVLSDKRFSLKYFGAQQQKGGVSYKIASEGFVPQAFIGRGGDVLRRSGFRLIKLFGPSPWRMFVKSGLVDSSVDRIEASTAKNVTDRITRMFRDTA